MSARIAIVIPVHRHSVLVDDAIASALALEHGEETLVIAVNDGCPHPETRATLEGWAALAPGRVRVLHQPNRGLSAARNAGITLALSACPELEAIFFLDADNRLDAHAVAVWRAALEASQADWFYPQFDFFGLEGTAHSGGAFSPALMSESNFCDAGSLVRRRVFDAGLRFDPAFRQGYEDWDFWLSAAGAGFSGEPFGEAFFRYRKRGESMLSGSHATDAALRAQLQAKHRWLYDRDGIFARLPAQTLLVETGAGKASEFTDPDVAREIAMEAAIDRLLDARARPAEVWQPSAWVVARPGVLDHLSRWKLHHAALWRLRQWIGEADVAALSIRRAPDGQIRIDAAGPGIRADDLLRPRKGRSLRERKLEEEGQKTLRKAEREALAGADMLMVATGFVERQAFRRRVRPDGKVPASTPLERASVATVTCLLPEKPERAGETPVAVLAHTCDQIRDADARAEPGTRPARWRIDPATARPRDMDVALRKRAFGGLPLPLKPAEGRLRVGFVVPIFRFGGVEKCVVALARELTALGVDCHLFVFGTDPMTATEWMVAPFRTVLPLCHPGLRDWSGPQYVGTNLSPVPDVALMRDIFSPLTGMDVVVTTGVAALGHELGFLRSRGVVTVSWEHLLETGLYGRSYGTPYLALAYEAGLDLVLACSDGLRSWLHGQGVPRDKLMTLRNGPGFPAERQARVEQDADTALRVGFFGRLDRQKGVDRFVAIAQACRGEGMAFSITGGAVVETGQDIAIPDWIARHPAAVGLDDLNAAYGRLDVLLMPSRDEGLPLSIFEAQRAGVIPVVSNVGAVAEAVEDGVNGVLLDPARVVEQGVERLRQLAADGALRARIAAAGRDTADRWPANARLILERIQSIVADRNASRRFIAASSSASEAAKDSRI